MKEGSIISVPSVRTPTCVGSVEITIGVSVVISVVTEPVASPRTDFLVSIVTTHPSTSVCVYVQSQLSTNRSVVAARALCSSSIASCTLVAVRPEVVLS
jgi:hypothetical protein